LDGSSGSYVGGDNACHNLAVTVWKGFVSRIGAYTLTAADSGKYIICTGGSWTLTLPAPALGLYFQVKNDQGISGTTGTITIQPPSGTIDGLASLALLPQQECTIITDGSSWRTLGKQRIVVLGTQDITSAQANASILLPVGYRVFELEFTSLLSATDTAYICARISQDGGTTFPTTGYYSGAVYPTSPTAVAYQNTLNGTLWYFGAATSNVVGNISQIQVKVFPGNATNPATYLAQSEGYYSTQTRMDLQIWGGLYGVSSPINALQYMFNAGNIIRCSLTVKGVV